MKKSLCSKLVLSLTLTLILGSFLAVSTTPVQANVTSSAASVSNDALKSESWFLFTSKRHEDFNQTAGLTGQRTFGTFMNSLFSSQSFFGTVTTTTESYPSNALD